MLEEEDDEWTIMGSLVSEEEADNGGLSDSFDMIALAQRVNHDLMLAELEYSFFVQR